MYAKTLAQALATSLILVGIAAATAMAADYRIEPLDESPPDEVSEAVTDVLSPTGYRVIRGSDTKFCDIWLAKSWEVAADFQPTPEVLYPFKQGQLIGVARYWRDATDFREQEIGDGVYTLRYNVQPIDGAHVGTSPTRDFLLVVESKEDDSPKPIENDDLNYLSSEAIQTLHPGILSMQRRQADAYPAMREDTNHQWWIVGVAGSANGKELPIEFVLVGISPEI